MTPRAGARELLRKETAANAAKSSPGSFLPSPRSKVSPTLYFLFRDPPVGMASAVTWPRRSASNESISEPELMKNRHVWPLAFWLVIAPAALAAPGGMFTYQGRLLDGGQPANGEYDLQFALSDAPLEAGYIDRKSVV